MAFPGFEKCREARAEVWVEDIFFGMPGSVQQIAALYGDEAVVAVVGEAEMRSAGPTFSMILFTSETAFRYRAVCVYPCQSLNRVRFAGRWRRERLVQVQLLGFSTPSTGKARRACPSSRYARN